MFRKCPRCSGSVSAELENCAKCNAKVSMSQPAELSADDFNKRGPAWASRKTASGCPNCTTGSLSEGYCSGCGFEQAGA